MRELIYGYVNSKVFSNSREKDTFKPASDNYHWCLDYSYLELGMYRISAPAPAGPASSPLLEVQPRSGSGQNCGRIWPDLGQPF